MDRVFNPDCYLFAIYSMVNTRIINTLRFVISNFGVYILKYRNLTKMVVLTIVNIINTY